MGWSRPEYAELAALIRERTGLTFPAARQADMEEALRRALDDQAEDPDRLRRLLAHNSAARDELIASLTIGESYFFRDPGQFAILREEVLPALAERRGDATLRLWSAGCAAGEEPYSLAILCEELGLHGRASVLGTDISRVRLSAAQRGIYTKWALRGMTAETIERYFTRQGKSYTLRAPFREHVDFRYLNLAEDQYPSLTAGIWGLDVILCRNVLIYFDHDTVVRVAQRLIDSLSEDGWLLMGASDPALSELVDCDVVLTRSGLAYRRPGRSDELQISVPAVEPGEQPWLDTPAAWSPDAAQPSAADEAASVGAAEWWELADDAEAMGAAARQPVSAATMPVDLPAAREAPEPVRAAYAARDYPRAARLAAELLTAHDSPALRVLQVRALANVGDLAAAGEASAAALERHRGSAELMYLHAVLLSEAGRWRDAAAAARRALYLDRSMVVAHIALALALKRLNDDAGALRAFHNADALLNGLAAEEPVAAADGETAGRLRASVRAQLRVLESVA